MVKGDLSLECAGDLAGVGPQDASDLSSVGVFILHNPSGFRVNE